MIRMLKIFLPILVVALALALPQSGMAARDFAEIYTDCGIGGMIAPRSDAVAAVTNVTWDLGTTAISSNISSPDSCSGGQAEKAAFIHDSYDALENDLASGHGTYLDALVALAGHDGQAQQRFIAALRSGFAKLVAAPDYNAQSRYTQAEALYNLVNRESEEIAASTARVGQG